MALARAKRSSSRLLGAVMLVAAVERLDDRHPPDARALTATARAGPQARVRERTVPGPCERGDLVGGRQP
jgi:hypothetical protein